MKGKKIVPESRERLIWTGYRTRRKELDVKSVTGNMKRYLNLSTHRWSMLGIQGYIATEWISSSDVVHLTELRSKLDRGDHNVLATGKQTLPF